MLHGVLGEGRVHASVCPCSPLAAGGTAGGQERRVAMAESQEAPAARFGGD